MNGADPIDPKLDRVLAELRDEELAPHVVDATVDRVWQRLDHARSTVAAGPRMAIRGCADFQALVPLHRQGALTAARRMLVEDHLAGCVQCRKAFQLAPRAAGTPVRAGSAGRGLVSAWSWRLAAAAVVALAVVGFGIQTDVFSFETGGLVRIDSVQGEAFRVSERTSVPVAAGQEVTLERGESIRTAKGSSAMLRLADDSRVEMHERSALAVKDRRSWVPGRRTDGVIELERGSLIVEASPQGSGHLWVKTEECRVAVTGTVFTVNHGMKGSRVSVLEGEVHVDHHGAETVLEPGDQVTTQAALAKVSIDQEVAWSPNVAHYRALLAQLRDVGREMDRVIQPGQRHGTALLDLAPARTAVYFAVPNVTGGLAQAYAILQEKVATNDVLREWWEKGLAADGSARQLERIIDEVRAYGDQFGEEIVFALPLDAAGEAHAPLLLAELRDPAGFRQFLAEHPAPSAADGAEQLHLQLFEEDLDSATAVAEPALYLWRHGSVIAASPQLDVLRGFAAERAQNGGLATTGDAFHARLAERYDAGVEWLLGVDLGRMVRAGAAADAPGRLTDLGLADAEYLIAEREQQGQNTENRAVLTFSQARRGVAAWLAAPGPLGALDFVGPDATLAAAFVLKEPRLVVDELFRLIGKTNPDFEAQLAQFQRDRGIDVRSDFAEPLGGEFVVAVDGPVLPVPSWKVIFEVYDPVRLERTIAWLVSQANDLAAQAGHQGFEIVTDSIDGRAFHRIRSLDTQLSATYMIEGGYFVAAPSRALLERALQYRQQGNSLTRSARFIALLPVDGEVNSSAVIYQNLSSVVGPLVRQLDTGDPGQRALVEAFGSDAAPTLSLLYGEADRIAFVSTSEGGLFGSSIGTLLSLEGLADFQRRLTHAVGSAHGEGAAPAESAGPS